MNGAYFHLLINHLPIIGFFIATLLLFMMAAMKMDKSVFYAVLLVLLLSSIGAVLSVISGEKAERFVENKISASPFTLDLHQELAETSRLMALAAGLSGLGLLLITRRRNGVIPTWGWSLVTIVTVVTFLMMSWTGLSGVKIRHTEFVISIPGEAIEVISTPIGKDIARDSSINDDIEKESPESGLMK